MTQRIFDIENKKDYADLWDILPDNIEKIKQRFQDGSGIVYYTKTGACVFDSMEIIKINWHNKTEITRPIQEATEADIGKICAFWEDGYKEPVYSRLHEIDCEKHCYKYVAEMDSSGYEHCRRLTKQEIKELC